MQTLDKYFSLVVLIASLQTVPVYLCKLVESHYYAADVGYDCQS